MSLAPPDYYRGRFAPSPSGPLHFGSLVTAMASFLEARVHHGTWLVRMEDVDHERCSMEAAQDILRTLHALGFEWDEEVIFQSQREDYYHAALTKLQTENLIFPCACSRKDIHVHAKKRSIDGGPIYPGLCKYGLPAGVSARAWRIHSPDKTIHVIDQIQGASEQNLAHEVGDFILFRADGQFAYQLAVVADDAAQNITAIVRGTDLLESTHRQIWLQTRLGFSVPSYAHIPIILDENGNKLSKQNHAKPVQADSGSHLLSATIRTLGISPPEMIAHGPIQDFWSWAIEHWNLDHIPKHKAMTAPPNAY